MKFWVPKKLAKSVPKCIKKGNKKVNEKKYTFCFFEWILQKHCIRQVRMGLVGLYIVFHSVFARPEKATNDVECSQNLGKT